MGKTDGPGMFSGMTKEEIQTLFAELGAGAEAAPNYDMRAELGQVREDVRQAIKDRVGAEYAVLRARAEAEAAERRAQAEAGDTETYIDFF
jgi:hypothetical protein